jgi:alpha-L-arabinofuranosidase
MQQPLDGIKQVELSGEQAMMNAVIRAGLWGSLMLALAQPLAAQTSPAPIVAEIAADKPGPAISRDIFGQFAEMLGQGIYGGVWVGKDSRIANVRGIRSDVVAALRAIKVPNVRWPGGCFADEYNWRDGIGPAAARNSHINMWGDVIEPNTFGTHEFMDFVEQIGSEAYLSVNVGRGTPEQAADWLEYMTADKPTTLARQRMANGRKAPWRVKFVGLGNESWGCGGPMSADHYANQLGIFANFTKSHHPDQVGSFIKSAPFPMQRIAVGQGLGETAYTEAVMKVWSTRRPYDRWNIDALSLHYYTGYTQPMSDSSTDFGEKEYAGMLRNTLKMNDMIVEHAAIMDKYDPGKKVALSIDEWGLWLQPISKNFMFLRQQNSLRDALAAALNFNIFARHADRVRMANIAQMVNVIQSVILTDGPKMLLTPTYHVHKMYLPFQDAQLIPVTYTAETYRFGDVALPQIDMIAARAKDGQVWLAITNLDPMRAVAIAPQIGGMQPKSAVGEVLTAERVNAINTFDNTAAVAPAPYSAAANGGRLVLQLAPKSVTVVRLQQ